MEMSSVNLSPSALVGVGSNIAAGHEIPASNAECAGSYITGAFARENLRIQLFGGGAGTRTRVQRSINRSHYVRIPCFSSRESGSRGQDPFSPARLVSLYGPRTRAAR